MVTAKRRSANTESSYGKVSVVMPAYNCARWLYESVESVRAQTYTDWELLLVDDGSTDDTSIIAAELAHGDGRIRLFHTAGRQGPAAARNLALDNATGEYVAFLDADDFWLPEKLERQLLFMHENNAAFSCTAYRRVSAATGETLGFVCPFPKADYKKVLYYANPVGNSTAMYRREGLTDLRVPAIRKRNDFALWLSLLKRVDFAWGLAECLGGYRVRVDSVSADKWALLRYQWQLYRNVEKLNLYQCAQAFLGLAYIKVFHPTWRMPMKKEKENNAV